MQRFSLGFRGPLCLVAGFLGVNSAVFASGVAAGAFGTMALQICAVSYAAPWRCIPGPVSHVIQILAPEQP